MRYALLALSLALLSAGCASAPVRPAEEARSAPSRPAGTIDQVGRGEVGLASFYADSLQGRRTASGQPYDRGAATCAHRTHRFGTRLEVKVLDTGKKAQCRVNDRGPFVRGRVVDVSRSVAERLGLVERGVVKVQVTPVEPQELRP